MQPQVYVLPIVLMILFGGYAAWMMSKSKKAQAGFGPAMHGFFAKSGYRYTDMPPEPIDMHVQRAVADMHRFSSGNFELRYVRSFHGLPIEFASGGGTSDGGYSFWSRWSVRLPRPPRVLLHVSDKSLASVGKAVREAFSSMTRQWQPRYPHQVQTGIPQVDARFVIFGVDPNAVRMMLQQNAALVASLLQCTEVDLWIDQQEAAFTDPMQKNINAAMGGMVGSMALGFDYGKRMDVSLPVHDRIAEVLAMAVRASQ